MRFNIAVVGLVVYSEVRESGVEPCLQKYKLPELSQIKEMSKHSFCQKVKSAVAQTAFGQLVAECHGLKKTANLVYESFKLQDYFFPSQNSF